MSFSYAVQWWEDWQLRILVLASLFCQYFLFFLASRRKRSTSPWSRLSTWIAYLGSDAIAVYALATLFNRHRAQDWVVAHRSRVGVEALWAPILLIHLGGQDGITAFNIEDNELWRRHVLTSISQVTVAIYVFCKSRSGDKKLLQAAVLVFILGIHKCVQKPLALRKASFNTMMSSTCLKRGPTDDSSLKDYVAKAIDLASREPAVDPAVTISNSKATFKPPKNLFVDIAYPYDERLDHLEVMHGSHCLPVALETLFERSRPGRRLDGDEIGTSIRRSHWLVRYELSCTFDQLYTKGEMYVGRTSRFLRYIGIVLIFVAVGLYDRSHRGAYEEKDVQITYALLCCTAALELMVSRKSVANDTKMRAFFSKLLYCTLGMTPKLCADQLAQCNLLRSFVMRRDKSFWVTRMLGVEVEGRLWPMEPCKDKSLYITQLVHDHVLLKGWKKHITDEASYSAFNENRGQLTLELMNRTDDLIWSIRRRPFDESVLLWHLATDFCLGVIREKDPAPAPGLKKSIQRCSEISNYMAHLLLFEPEMLITGARPSLFNDAFAEIKIILDAAGPHPTEEEEEDLSLKIFRKLQESSLEEQQDTGIIHQARRLATKLMMDSRNNNEPTEVPAILEVLQGVWVEMLCFSAARCRGYLHAKSLGKGGEYLSQVWMLLSYMGMESLAERMQITAMDRETKATPLLPGNTPP